jgi:hypothetical protein
MNHIIEILIWYDHMIRTGNKNRYHTWKVSYIEEFRGA